MWLIIILIILIILIVIVSLIKIEYYGGAVYDFHNKKIIISQKFPQDTAGFLNYCRNLPYNITYEIVEETNSRFDLNVTIEQLKSFKNTQLTLKYLKGLKDPKLIKELKLEAEKLDYEGKFQLVHRVQEKYKCNPLNIISTLGLEPELKNDERLGIFSLPSQHKSREDAVKFEKVVEHLIAKMSIDYITENDMKGAKLTPDILLKDSNLYYETEKGELVKINWIDAKNYPYYANELTHEKLINRANAYTAEFGAGLYVFNGVWSNIVIKNAFIIDYKNLV